MFRQFFSELNLDRQNDMLYKSPTVQGESLPNVTQPRAQTGFVASPHYQSNFL